MRQGGLDQVEIGPNVPKCVIPLLVAYLAYLTMGI